VLAHSKYYAFTIVIVVFDQSEWCLLVAIYMSYTCKCEISWTGHLLVTRTEKHFKFCTVDGDVLHICDLRGKGNKLTIIFKD